MKIYKLLIDSPEYPKGTQAVFLEEYLEISRHNPDHYALFFPRVETYGLQHSFGTIRKILVDNRPDVWELQNLVLTVNKSKTEIEHHGKTYKLSPFIVPEEVVDNEYRAFVPKHGEKYYFIDHQGNVQSTPNMNDRIDNRLIKQGVYRTARAAKMEALRRESRAKAWMPEGNDIYYFVGIITGEIKCEVYEQNRSYNIMEFLQGNCHPDKQSAQKWKDEGYWEAFNCLF